MNTESNSIIQLESTVFRYSNQNNIDAAQVYAYLNKQIGCTYLIYMHEDLLTNKKYVYSSNWEWQNLLIGNFLINSCPIFLTAFKYLERKQHGHLFIPWYSAPPSNSIEKNVCGLRGEFNIAHGLGYGAKGNGVRETLAFGGNLLDKTFYKNFIDKPNLFYATLSQMRNIVLLNNHKDKIIIDPSTVESRYIVKPPSIMKEFPVINVDSLENR